MTPNERNPIARTIRDQIGLRPMLSIGAHEYAYGEREFRFKARIIPFKKNGRRGTRPRIMQVSIKLNGNDYYDIEITWRQGTELFTHYKESDVPAEVLPVLFLKLDYDGDEVLNPRDMT